MRLFLFLAMLLLSGCSLLTYFGDEPAPAPAAKTAYYYHKVAVPGETLAIVAQWYTGKAQNWKTILVHNPSLEITRIRIGDQIRIPEYMLVKRAPLPRSAVAVEASNGFSASAKVGETAFDAHISRVSARVQ